MTISFAARAIAEFAVSTRAVVVATPRSKRAASTALIAVVRPALAVTSWAAFGTVPVTTPVAFLTVPPIETWVLVADTVPVVAITPATAFTALVLEVWYIPASPLPENVISADAMPAVATRAVVAIRRFFMSFPSG